MSPLKSYLYKIFGHLEIYQEIRDLMTPTLEGIDLNGFEGSGLEIGGPSKIFRKSIPVYKRDNNIDFANFSNQTIWEGEIRNFEPVRYYKKRKGRRLISEATELNFKIEKPYDFIISSNCLEHVANPIKALKRWKNVLKNNGKMILILPNKKSSFDHLRSITTIDHLIEDYIKDSGEDDLTHLEEILQLHDLNIDKPAGTFQQFKVRSLNNFLNRGLHHHVFNEININEMLKYSGFNVLNNVTTKIDHIFIAYKN